MIMLQKVCNKKAQFCLLFTSCFQAIRYIAVKQHLLVGLKKPIRKTLFTFTSNVNFSLESTTFD